MKIIESFDKFFEAEDSGRSEFSQKREKSEEFDKKIEKEKENFLKAKADEDTKAMKIANLNKKKLEMQKSIMMIDYELQSLK
jgi:hypothetical protein